MLGSFMESLFFSTCANISTWAHGYTSEARFAILARLPGRDEPSHALEKLLILASIPEGTGQELSLSYSHVSMRSSMQTR